MEPWDGPASIAFTDGTRHRRGPRPQRPAPVALRRHQGRPGRHGVRGRRARHRARERRAQGPAAARPHVPRRHRARAASSTTTRSRQSMAARKPYRQWLDENLMRLERPARARREPPAGVLDADTLLARQQAFGYTHRGPAHPDDADGAERPGGGRLDGQRHAARGALGQAAAALQLLQAALRAGHQPADRPDPRGAGDVARDARSAPSRTSSRRRREHCRQLELEEPDPRPTRSCAQIKELDDRGAARRRRSPTLFAVERRRRRPRAGARRALRGEAEAPSPTAHTILVLSDRGVDARARADPEPARDGGRAPSPDPRGQRARAAASSSSPASRARCSTSACCSATAPARSTRTSRSRRSATWCARASCKGVDARRGGRELPQGRRQGRPQGDVQDGHLDAAELPRRADLRGDRPQPRARSTRTSPARASRIEGVGLDVIAARARRATTTRTRSRRALDGELEPGGQYQWRRRGEYHMYNPDTVAKLQHAVRAGSYEMFKEYTDARATTRAGGSARSAACSSSRPARRSRSTRSSRRARSSSASRPARCRSARSAARRTRTSRSR